MKRRFLLITAALFLVVAGSGAMRFHAWGTAHVDEMTGDPRWKPDCVACHMDAGIRPAFGWRPDVHYRSPKEMAISADGKRLYVTASGDDKLLAVDTASRKVVGEASVGTMPLGVCLSSDGQTAYVSNHYDQTVSVVDTASMQTVRTLQAGNVPAGLAVSADGNRLFVANTMSNDISVIDLKTGSEICRLGAGNNPYAMCASPDRRYLFVTNRLTDPTPYEASPVSELTVVDTAQNRVIERRQFTNANMVLGVACAPMPGGPGNAALVLTAEARPKNLVPAVQVARGWMMTGGIGLARFQPGVESKPIISQASEPGETQVMLDDLNRYYADPSDVAIMPSGRYAYVSHSGADTVSAIDIGRLFKVLHRWDHGGAGRHCAVLANDLSASRDFVVARIPTASCPNGLTMSPDGRCVYVADQLSDEIQVIDTSRNAVVANIDLGGPRQITLRREGERLFHIANHSFQNQFSCASCHPDGHDDGLAYELESNGIGQNIVQNRTLQQIETDAPFKWSGVSKSFYRQCGIRFATFLTRADPYTPEQLNALVAYIRTIPRYPNEHHKPGQPYTDSELRGKAIFERAVDSTGAPIPVENRCITCHGGPDYTDHKLHDVDTATPLDTRRMFSTPHLNNVYQMAPYLHSGKAQTLEEIWTVYGKSNRHGAVNDLKKEDLNDLVHYLETL